MEAEAAGRETEGERLLLKRAPSGELVDLRGLPEEERAVSADVIRRLCVGAESQRVDPRGIGVRGARVTGGLDLSFATVAHPLQFVETTFAATPNLRFAEVPAFAFIGCSLPGLNADGVRANGIFLRRSKIDGEVRLRGATIGGNLECGGATLSNNRGNALSADGARITGNVFLTDKFAATGEVRFPGVMIGGDLACVGAALSNNRGNALLADGARITGYVFLTNRFTATGEVRLLGATIGGNLDCSGATLSNDGGYALSADGARITGNVFLTDKFAATGEVRLFGATIGGNLECDGATLSNNRGNALSAEGARITGGVFLRSGFTATGTILLLGASIGGVLALRNARLAGRMNLFHAHATSLVDDVTKEDSQGSWSGADPLVLDGFVYDRSGPLTEWDPGVRCKWLEQTDGYQHGAWQQLVAFYRAAGRDDDATRAAIAMQNDRMRRAGLPRYRVAGRWVLRKTIGHGYRPWRAGIWAVAVIAAFAFLVWNWSELLVPAQGSATGSAQPVAYAADTFLPIIDLREAGDWRPTEWLRWLDWTVILLGWALSTIFVAGFTRLVRSE